MAKDRLVTFIERISPGYREARLNYAANSAPINRMDVFAHLKSKGTAATPDIEGNARLMPDALGRMTKDATAEKALIKSATGRDSPDALKEMLTPSEHRKLKAVVGETNTKAAALREGMGPGSPTTQRLAAQGLLKQFGGGLWGAQNSTLANTGTKVFDYIYRHVAEPKIQRILVDMHLNPGNAKKIMTDLSPENRGLVMKALNDKGVQQVMSNVLPAFAFATD